MTGGPPQAPDRQRQLETAAVILGLARAMVNDEARLTADELRYIARRLVEALSDALGIATGQGGEDRHKAPPPGSLAPKDGPHGNVRLTDRGADRLPLDLAGTDEEMEPQMP